IVRSMGGTLADFITMQILGITCFAIAANTSHHIVRRVGEPRTVLAGTAMTALGCGLTLGVGLLPDPPVVGLWATFVFVNTGLGVRGPAGFSRALHAAGDDPSRGSALIVLLVMLTAALGTAAVAPFIDRGLAWVAGLAGAVALVALWLSVPRSAAEG
ncbi:MAG: MFS transporter, partial [Pseudomonadota bacterium]